MSAAERFRHGAWRLVGARADLAALAGALDAHAAAGAKWRARPVVAGTELYVKGSPLAARTALRHGLARLLLARPEPRLAEFANLAWLRAHGFGAPRPRLAGVWQRAGLARYQFLATEAVPAPPLAEFLAAAQPQARHALLTRLAEDLARLHVLGFTHRDLFARNLLVRAGPDGPEPVFLDAWRGGPGPDLRGPLHDLGCLMLDGATLFSPEEQVLLLARYAARSGELGRPAGADLGARGARARARLVARERRRHPALAPEWNFPRSG